MSPKQLKTKHRLSYAKLAILLSKDQRTVERYCATCNYPDSISTLCYLLDSYLSANDSPPPTVWGEYAD